MTGEFPWTVAILKEEKALDGQILNVYVCGGSLIDPGKNYIENEEENKQTNLLKNQIVFFFISFKTF